MYKPKLTAEAVDWAYEKWLEGFTMEAIDKVLGCGHATLSFRFAQCGYTRERPPLRIPKGLRVREEDYHEAD